MRGPLVKLGQPPDCSDCLSDEVRGVVNVITRLPGDRWQGGLLVEGVNGPAAKAGMQPGDIILGLNNQPVTSVDQFRKLLEGAGNRFALLVQRGNSRIFLPIRMG